MRARAEAAPDWANNIARPRDALPSEIQEFLDWLRIVRNRSPNTVRGYRNDLAKFAAFAGHRSRVDGVCAGVDRGTLREFQIALATVLPCPRSRARALVALRGFLAFAYDEGWTDCDLSRCVVAPRFTQGDPHPVRAASMPMLLAALPRRTLRDHRDRALVHLLFSTGCRIAEACSLDRSGVRGDSFRVLGKGGKHRTVYLTPAARAALDQYLETRGVDRSPALLVNVSHNGTRRGAAKATNRLTTDGARKALRDLRRRMTAADPTLADVIAQLRSPHVLRHTLATALLEATGDVRLVQEVLGHATLDTLRVYTEITDTRKRAAYERFGEYMRHGTSPAAFDWTAAALGHSSVVDTRITVQQEARQWHTTTAA